jgi:hypothetical protein
MAESVVTLPEALSKLTITSKKVLDLPTYLRSHV